MGDDARGQRGGARHGRAERDGISRRPAARAATIAIVVALLAGSLAAAAMPAWAGTLTFTPDADSKVQQANPATNYGASTTLKVDGATDPIIESYLRFTVAGVATSVTGAKLRVFTTTNTSDGPAVYAASNSWTEAGVTWNTRPARTSGASDDVGRVASGVWVDIDVTPLVTGDGVYSFDVATSSTDGLTFSSREGTSVPQLVVTTADVSDTGPPSVPGNVSATAPSARRVVVSWDAAFDDVGVARYDVYRGGALLSSTQALTLDDTTVDPDTEYSYTVEAIDAAGHGSGQSPPAVVRTPVAPADQPPSSPTNLAASATGPYRVDLSWSPSTDDVGVARYDVYREGVRIDTVPSGTAYADTTVHPASTYSYTVQAIDTAGQPSAQSDAVSASTPADQHPSVPGDVRATAVSSTRVDVSWSASSDDVRVAGYDVYRDGARLASVADATTYSDASARPATTYSYTVEAIDSAGQGSGQSAGAPVTTPDHAPTAPTGVTATAVSSTRVELTWSASTDDVGVRGYDVLRDGVVLATVGAVTSTSDTTVKAGTRYSYQIRAIDTADQRSALSAAAVVTTPSGAADPVVAAAGDIACASTTPTSTQCRQQATADLLADATAVLPLGDNQYDSGTLAEYRGSYALSWGRFLARTFPAVGNHEYAVSSTAAGYFDYFGAAAGPRPQGYYSYNLGAWHVISLNSNCTKIGGCDSASAEYKWLQSDLAANPTRCTLAYWHHPLFGTGGGTTSVKPLWQLLYPAHADVVLNGHEHHYERFGPQTPAGAANASGIREFVVGTGGKSHSGFGTATPSATSQVRNSTTFGVLKLTLHPTSYDWRFVPESGKTFTDSGSTACV